MSIEQLVDSKVLSPLGADDSGLGENLWLPACRASPRGRDRRGSKYSKSPGWRSDGGHYVAEPGRECPVSRLSFLLQPVETWITAHVPTLLHTCLCYSEQTCSLLSQHHFSLFLDPSPTWRSPTMPGMLLPTEFSQGCLSFMRNLFESGHKEGIGNIVTVFNCPRIYV